MRRWQGCLILLLVAGPLLAQDWRPVSAIDAEKAQGISLGKPRLRRTVATPDYQAQPLPRESIHYQTARYPNELDRLPAPVLSSPNNSYSSYQGPAGSTAEEAFNCGVVPGKAPVGGAAPPPPPYGQPGLPPPPPPGGPAPAGAPTPWYQPVKDCWNRIFGESPGTASSGGLFSSWDCRSDQAFKDFISPVTNANFFEDPRSLTEFRTVFTYQKAPGDNSLLVGGSIFDFNLQGRISINDQWSIVLHRLAITNVNPGDGALDGYAGGTGLADIQVGPKWTFYRDTRNETLFALGANFEIPIGSSEVFASSGGGVTPYLSYGQGFLDNWHFLATTGYRVGFGDRGSDFFFLSAHLDYGFFKRFYPLVEMNWYRYTSNGNRYPVDYEGGDLFNIGAQQVAGENLVTLAAGFRFKFSESMQTGLIFEGPIVGSNMMERYRVMFDLIFKY